MPTTKEYRRRMSELRAELTEMIASFVDAHVEPSRQFTAAEQIAAIVRYAIHKSQDATLQEVDHVLCSYHQERRRALVAELSHPPGN